MFQALWALLALLIGLGVLVACFAIIRRISTSRWRRFADEFGTDELPVPMQTHTVAILLISDKPSRELMATGYQKFPPVVLGLHAQGLSLRVRWPFHLGCKPFILPYGGLRIQPTSWADLAGRQYALSHVQVPGAWIILHAEDVGWICDNSRLAPGPPIA